MRALDPITRTDFQRLSELRLREAEDLLTHDHDEGAYYLAGYAVECALKACICRRLPPEQFPPKPDTVRVMYSHRLVDLLAIAGLKAQLDIDGTADAALSDYWLVTKDWSEESRYALPTQADAQQLYTAVGDPVPCMECCDGCIDSGRRYFGQGQQGAAGAAGPGWPGD